MSKNFFLLFLIFILITITYPFNVFAEGCDANKLAELKAIAQKISVTVEYDEEARNDRGINQSIVTISGILFEDMYAVTKDGSSLFLFNDAVDGSVIEKVTTDSNSNELIIYSNICPNRVLRRMKLDLKKYNLFSEYEECNDIEEGELDVCNRFYSEDLTYEQFVLKVNKYKKERAIDDSKTNKITVNSLLAFLKKNLYFFIGIGIVIVCVIGFFLYKNYKDNKLD